MIDADYSPPNNRMKLKEMKRYKRLIIPSALIFLLIIPSVMGAFPLDCSYQCSANDVQITGAQISDQEGNDLPCRFCEPGNPASAYLALTIFNNAEAARYNIYVIYTLSLGGIDQTRTFSCLAASLGGRQTIKAEIPVSWTCGQSVNLKDIIVTWSTEPNENTCDIPRNCHAPGKSWCTPLLSVKTPLVAAFTSNSPQCICVPQSCQPIQFTDQTTGGSGTYTYLWDFSDGSTSTQKNPVKQYSAPGVYQVTITVSDGACSDSHSGQVTIYPAPIASFTSLPGICLGADLQFTDTSTPGTAAGISPASIVKWEWDFGDGSAHSLNRNPVHRYLSAGNYQVTLKVTDSRGCTASVTSSVQVYTNPVPTFTVDSTCFRPALSTSFHGQATQGSGTYSSFAWDFGDGNTGSGQNPSHQYANQGTYNVKLTVTDSHGCTGKTTAQVTIVDCDPPGIDGVTVFSETICNGLEQVVNAHVVDYVGVASVILNYQVNGGAVIQKAMTFVAGSGSVKDGLWTVEVPGQPAGTILTYWITAYDGTFTAQSAHYSISFIDCNPPAITSVKASTFHPCAGSDVLVTAHAIAGTGVSSVTIDYGGASYPMSGPAGSSSEDWTYSVPGSGKVAGDSIVFTVSATDALGRVVHSASFTITWRDCTPPEIISITPSDLSPCPPADVTITARITDDVGVVSAFLTYDGVDHPMSGPSTSGDWTATIPGSGRSAGDSVDYTVTALDAAGNSATSTVGKTTWRDCNAPVIQSIDLSSIAPCAGDPVTITARITDSSGVKSATLFIDGVPYPMSGPSGSDWFYAITGKAAGESISCYVSAKDTEDNTANSATFTITWKDCIAPVIGTPVLEPASPCAGNDVFVKVHITDNVGVTSATITYDGISYQMSGPIGPANDGDWTATIIGAGKKAGDSLSYSITAEDGAENTATPVTGSITWRDCTPPVVQSVDTSSSTPCAGTDVTITAHVTDDVAVASVDLYFDSAHHAMSGPVGSKSGDWTYTIAGRPAGTSLSYSVIANDGSNPSSPASGVITWRECENSGPDIVSITPSSATPCCYEDVLITAHLMDEDGAASAELVYDGTSYPMSGVAGSKNSYWTANIPGAGRAPGSSISYTVRALDTLGNPTVSGEFTITWRDCCPPEIGSIALSPHEPCAGEDVTVTVQITDNVGVASATLTAGGTDYPMTGPTGSISGEWTTTIPGTGIAAGYVLTFSISASDAAGNKATPATGQIHWRDCSAPDIQSVIPSNSQPCTGEDVTITAHIESNDGVASATLNFDSSSIPMSGPAGSVSGDWTATLPGSAMQAGQTVTYSITAKDSSGRTSVSESQTISWQDCSPPQISEITPGDIETCEGNGDLQITARIAATAGVVSARIIYEEEGEPGLYEMDMVRQGSDPKDSIWSGAISKRKVRTITYYITASTGKYTTTSQSNRAVFDECDEPELIDHEITAPCAGNDALLSFTIRDGDQDFYEAAITYEGKEYPLHLLGNDPYPLEGIWTGTIPGFGRLPGETLSISLKGYTLDTQGPNPPEGLGQFTVTWIDCKPGIISVTPGTTEICAGKDQVITARATSTVGISSVVIHYTDSTGQYETSMVIDAGADPKDASWTGHIPDHPGGTTLEYYIEARSNNDDLSRMPQEGSYRLTWLDCRPGILSVTPGTANVCRDNDQIIAARATSPVGISSMVLHYTDSAGEYESSMVIDQGADPKDASWTGLIAGHPEGSTADYYIVATSSDGEVARMPKYGSYRLTWVICKADLNKTASASTVLPGGTITYTITYQNRDSNTIYDVVIVESYPPGTIFISASPPPDSGTENRWTIGDLPAGASGTITIVVRAPDEAKIKFYMEQSAKGVGFVRTYKDFNTGREPQVLTNRVSMTGRGISGQFAVSRVTISGEAGTKLSMRESGSGSYAREEQLRYLRENRSIKDVSNLSASYQATDFQLPRNGSINYDSKWTDREKARNYVTAESVEESYRYATKIQKEGQIELDRNSTNMTVDSQFEGMRHAGYFKASKPDDKGRVSPLMEMSSDYTGSFRVKERLGTTYSNRSNAITKVMHYEMPHITIYQRSEIDNTDENNINYTISILNDGNRTLGPIYLMDLFPAGMSFFDASAHPSEDLLPDADHANWTFTSLPISRSLTIYLRLMRYVVLETPVNWVYVKAGYDGTWITANNSTLSNLNWLSSTPTGKPTGIKQKMITGDWNPPEWGFDQSPDICTSCTYSPPP